MTDLQLDAVRDEVSIFLGDIIPDYHDRHEVIDLIIDDVVYLFGASLKDAGKKLFAYIKMQETSALELLSNIR